MTRHRAVRIAVATLAAGLAARLAAGAGAAPRLLINESPSVPRGLYVRRAAPPDPGRLVAVGQPEVARRYLRTLGAPPGMPLLKRVVASGGAWVCVASGRMRWAGGSAAILDRDRSGRPLPHWSGCRRLAPDERLLLGDTSTSFDSRYFGPAPAATVLGVYEEVWTW